MSDTHVLGRGSQKTLGLCGKVLKFAAEHPKTMAMLGVVAGVIVVEIGQEISIYRAHPYLTDEAAARAGMSILEMNTFRTLDATTEYLERVAESQTMVAEAVGALVGGIAGVLSSRAGKNASSHSR